MATVQLYEEIERLKLLLEEKNRQVVNLETTLYNRSNDDKTVSSLKDQIERLSEANKRLLDVNQNLEDKLLAMAEHFDAERTQLKGQVESLQEKIQLTTSQLINAREEAESLRKDCTIAVQLLASNPRASQHVHQLLDSLNNHRSCTSAPPLESTYARNNASNKSSSSSSSVLVPFATFPPTASCVLVAGKNRRSSSDTEDGGCYYGSGSSALGGDGENGQSESHQRNKVANVTKDLTPSPFLVSSLNRIALKSQDHNAIHPEECNDRDPYYTDALIL